MFCANNFWVSELRRWNDGLALWRCMDKYAQMALLQSFSGECIVLILKLEPMHHILYNLSFEVHTIFSAIDLYSQIVPMISPLFSPPAR